MRPADFTPTRERLEGAAVTLPVTVAIFWIAYDGGSYSLASRNALAIAIWWTIAVGLAVGVFPRAPASRAAWITGGLLTAFAAWTAASIGWAASAEKAFDEFNRTTLYLGAFCMAVLAAKRDGTTRIADGLALGITGVGLAALGSRCFPELFPESHVGGALPSASTRLSFPVDYWNGLGVLLAMGFPLLLRSAVAGTGPLIRGISIAPLPALGATVFLTSSRGAVIGAAVAILAFLAITPRRRRAALAVALAAGGSATAIGVLLAWPVLIDGPYETGTAIQAGRTAALLIALTCVATALTHALATRRGGYRLARSRRARIGAGFAALAVTIIVIAATDPIDRLAGAGDDGNWSSVRAHFLTFSDSKRRHLWTSALDQFTAKPLIGDGAGSFEAWWAEHRPVPVFVRDAHSLWLETLGELGLLGFVLLSAAFTIALVEVASRARAHSDPDRSTLAALAGSLVAFALAASVDWMWEFTVVSLVGFFILGLLTGPSTVAAAAGADRPPEAVGRPRWGLALRAGCVVAAVVAIAAQTVGLLAHEVVRESQAAAARGDHRAALSSAAEARELMPWAVSPRLQLALVHEQLGEFRQARRAIRSAIARDSRDWRLWLVASRIEVRSGAIRAARTSLERARELNPRSPLFSSTVHDKS